jgi:hypothetical protein
MCPAPPVVAYLGGLNLSVLADYLKQRRATEAVLFADADEARRVTEQLQSRGRPAQLLRVTIEEVCDADAETP